MNRRLCRVPVLFEKLEKQVVELVALPSLGDLDQDALKRVSVVTLRLKLSTQHLQEGVLGDARAPV